MGRRRAGRGRGSLIIGLATVVAISAGCGDAESPVTDDAAARSPARVEVPATREVAVYFTVDERTRAVRRPVAEGEDALAAALQALLRGPTGAESDSGITSFFSERTAGMLRGVELDTAGRATIDFGDLRPLIPNASTSAGSGIMLAELDATVFQFDEVRSARYRIEGDCDAFWNWLQRGCEEVRRAEP
jgi:spore germination protein GerM